MGDDAQRVRIAQIVFNVSEFGDDDVASSERAWNAATQEMRDDYLRIADRILALLSQPAAQQDCNHNLNRR